jgi:hypothetical protein
MNCAQFEEILADFFEKALPDEAHAAAVRHLAMCANCRKLLEILRGDVDVFPVHMDVDFSNDVLARTSGSVCQRTESSLWDFVRRELNPEENDLISMHLEHCLACRSTAAEMALLQETLSEMADVDPGEPFTAAVVGITSGLRRLRPGFRTRFQQWWQCVVQRPLFSLEAAYVATLFMFFIFSPILPFREMASQKLPSIWVRAKEPASSHLQYLASTVSRGNAQFAGSLSGILEHTGKSVNSMLDKSVQAVGVWKKESKADLQWFWQRLTHSVSKNNSMH